MEADPFSGDIKRLDPPGWRRRLGNYRIFYDLDVGERLIASDLDQTPHLYHLLRSFV
jgi:hypothetical protein